jgi:hypothetical protein
MSVISMKITRLHTINIADEMWVDVGMFWVGDDDKGRYIRPFNWPPTVATDRLLFTKSYWKFSYV